MIVNNIFSILTLNMLTLSVHSSFSAYYVYTGREDQTTLGVDRADVKLYF